MPEYHQRMKIEWKNPPPPEDPRHLSVARELMKNPGKWALIQKSSPAMQLMPWWGPIYRDPRFETKIVKTNPTDRWMEGTRDIYARYIPIEEHSDE